MALVGALGWLADHLPRAGVIVGCVAVTAICAALLPLAVESLAVSWPVLFVWGGAYYGIYTLSLVTLGERFSGATLVAGTAAFGAMWGVGGLAGPPVVGAVMDAIGPVGLPVTFATIFGLLTVVLAVASTGRARTNAPSQEAAY